MSDDEIIKALERQGELLQQRGRSVRAAEGRRIAGTLRQAVKEHRSSVDEVTRCEKRANAAHRRPEDSTAWELAQAVMRLRWTQVTGSREHARRFLDSPH